MANLSRVLTNGRVQPEPCHRDSAVSRLVLLRRFYFSPFLTVLCFSLFFASLRVCFCLVFVSRTPKEIPRPEKGAGAQETAHQEAAKRLHALHERDACERGRRVHAEGERRHQSDPGAKGRWRRRPLASGRLCPLWYTAAVSPSDPSPGPVTGSS